MDYYYIGTNEIIRNKNYHNPIFLSILYIWEVIIIPEACISRRLPHLGSRKTTHACVQHITSSGGARRYNVGRSAVGAEKNFFSRQSTRQSRVIRQCWIFIFRIDRRATNIKKVESGWTLTGLTRAMCNPRDILFTR